MYFKLELFELRDVHFYTKERNWSSTDLPCLAKTRIGDRSFFVDNKRFIGFSHK